MTDQEIFDKVATHLLKQGRKCRAPILRSGRVAGERCAYRNERGDKCAIGALISDEAYTEDLEGVSVTTAWDSGIHGRIPFTVTMERGLKLYNVLQQTGIKDEQFLFLRDLQEIHDGYEPEDWQRCLRECAEDYGLNATVVNEHATRLSQPITS